MISTVVRLIFGFVFGGMSGAFCGMIPLLVAVLLYFKNKQKNMLLFGAGAWIICVIGGMILGTLCACPLAIVLSVAIAAAGLMMKS